MANLFDPPQRGGVIAGSGFNFQDAFIVLAMLGWIGRAGFHSLLKEGFEDVDVRFDGPDGSEIWHYQLKDHQVKPGEFREVLERFAGQVRSDRDRFILACCGLSQKLEAVWRKALEFRGAARTYTAEALAESRSQLHSELEKVGCGKWSDFVIDRLEVEHENPGIRESIPVVLLERFRGRFLGLSGFGRPELEALDRLFHLLIARVNRSIRVGIPIADIERMISEELVEATRGPFVSVHLHGWIRQDHGVPADHEIDWTEHFDHPTLRVPTPSTWDTTLLPELVELRRKLDADSSKRNIRLASRAPLSAGLGFGHVFAEAAGYTIDLEQPSPSAPGGQEIWRMGQLGTSGLLDVVSADGDPNADEVAVGIGVAADPRPAVESFAAASGLPLRASLYLYPMGGPSMAAVNKDTVGSFAIQLKDAMRLFISPHNPRVINLFYVGPLGLAVLLGQRLNGLGTIQCFERSRTDGYVPSCRLLA